MARFQGIPVETPAPTQAARPRFAGVPAEEPAKVTDLASVHARLSPQDDPMFTFPERPGNGEDLLAWARFKRPELENLTDQQLATRIRREVYPDMPAAEFYRETGLGQKFGFDLSETEAPTAGMSGFERFKAGVGSAMAATPHGVRQGITEGAGTTAKVGALALEALGADDAARAVVKRAVLPLQDESDRLRTEETERRRLDAPLMRTGAGLAGNITGNVVQAVGPGVTLKLASKVPQFARAAPALEAAGAPFLPETVKGSALSGAGLGAVQPVAEGETREGNIGWGLGGGALGAAIPRGIGAGARFAGNLVPSVSERTQTRAAARVLEEFSQDPQAMRAALAQEQRIIPGGSRPSLAEATEDIGIAGLQKAMSNTPRFGANLRELNEARNRERVAYIESQFGGANAAKAEALAEARDLAARQELRGIAQTPVSRLDSVQAGVNRLSVKYQANRPIREAMAEINDELANVKTVQDAHFLRQYIGTLMAGQVEGKQSAKLAKKELMVVRDLLDRQMRQDFPQWGQFLKNYKAASREIGQVNVGEALLDRGPNIRAVGDIPVLSPDKFAGAAKDLDRLTAQATNFRGAKAERVLTPAQIQAVDEVRRDLERYARSTGRIRTAGSDTVQNALGGNAVQDAVGPVGAAIIEPVSGVALLGLNAIRKSYGQKVAAIVEDALLDPNRAAEILATLPPENRRKIVAQVAGLLQQTGGTAGRVAAPAGE